MPSTVSERRDPLVRVLVALIDAYRVLGAGQRRRCRFAPSCSEYARGAMIEHGAARGLGLALRRISRCHPLHPGGYDPVPGGRG